MDRIRIQKTKASTSGRSFLSRRLTKSQSGEDVVPNPKGPLGLNTLHHPQRGAVVDLIFVHGLGGGSRSTWTKLGDPSSYWIQEWLSNDPGFEDARIHSFGYNSNWEKESILNLHDFAKSLLGSIQDCPSIPRDSKVPLIFVGHSMGGLVIKRAYILASQEDAFQSLAERVCAIFFLATPHRGAGLAQTLSKILSLDVFSGSRPFVEDLHPNSIATQSINDEFPQHCQGLQLYSFYETLPISFRLGKSFVVDKGSATLGYANERTAYLNANHREVCKYSNQADPNYQTVRNAIASAIDNLRDHASASRQELNYEQYRLLGASLGVSEAPENDFMDADAIRIQGSCEWMLEKSTFLDWRDSVNTCMFWISAKPATGKTILCGRIIQHLKDLDRSLAFYFFDFRDKAKMSISAFLLSMAWQMAQKHTEVLTYVLAVCEQDDQLRKADYRTIWRRVFLEGILRIRFIHTQYWVIDANGFLEVLTLCGDSESARHFHWESLLTSKYSIALDECKNDSELVPLLLKAGEICSIRIVSTSRHSVQVYRHVIHSKVLVVSDEIREEDIKPDIKLYLEANMDQLPEIDQEARHNMISIILAKSAGCFLWVSLILQELRQVHTSAEIRQVLEEVPSDMDELYLRILDSMSKAPHGKELAKAILTWAVCSARPLTTDEMFHALQIDLKDSIDNIDKSIESSCGQLIYVDAQSHVQMIHQTARDFLFKIDKSTSEFAIDARGGHMRLVTACLHYLNGPEMKGPRHRRLGAIDTIKERCPFVIYACNEFYEHMAYISPMDDQFLAVLARFLDSSNVLSWIEYIAQRSHLNRLIEAGKALRHLLQRQSKHVTPLGREVAVIESWAIDLTRLVTKFGRNLSASPPSIFHLVPPFCPTASAPYKQFALSARGIAILGLSATTWDDCMSTITPPNAQERFSALACSDKYFAIGTFSGKILIYNETTCQEIQTLQHQESVKLLQFSKGMNILASAGHKVVRVWDTLSWQQTSYFQVANLCLAFTFFDEQQLLLAAMRDNHLMIWDLVTATLRDSSDWTLDLEGPNAHASRRPIVAAFCIESYLMAIVYRGQDILLWDLERDALHDNYCKETGARAYDHVRQTTAGATGLIFSPAPSANLLAASYSDGDLVLFDTTEGRVSATTVANAHSLACSPDGRTLATGNSSGTLQLFDFETLKLLYRIHSEDYLSQQLAFSNDGHRLVDIRGSQCCVWDPPVLVREDFEESSESMSVSTTRQEINLGPTDDIVLITSLACPKKDEYFFCGKEDGAIFLYDFKSGKQIRKLFTHANGVSILSLSFYEESDLIVSIDSSSRTLVHKLTRKENGWIAHQPLFDHRAGMAVNQVLVGSDATRLLVSTSIVDALWLMPPSEPNSIAASLTWQDRRSYRWEIHPLQQDQLILIANNTVQIHDWKTLGRLTTGDGILLEGSILPELSLQSIVPCFAGSIMGTTFSKPSSSSSHCKLLLWDTFDLSMDSKRAVPIPKYRSLTEHVQTLIGEYGQGLVFLHSSGWVCSANLRSPSVDEYTRHFFLPADWLSTNMDHLFGITHHGVILFVKRHEVAVIKRGLEADDKGQARSSSRPSLLRGKKPSLEVPDIPFR